MITQWTNQVNKTHPWPEYPQPQFERSEWINLNGLWKYHISPRSAPFQDKNGKSSSPTPISDWEGEILVPYPIESFLSGVQKALLPDQYLWYYRTFSIPSKWNQTILLHFGAVDWETTVWINGHKIGSHKGGYTPFSFDITQQIHSGPENEILIRVWDPTDKGMQERGKQSLNPKTIFYTASSGIWQTIWLESVPHIRIESLQITPDVDKSQIKIEAPIFSLEKLSEQFRMGITIRRENYVVLSHIFPFDSKECLEKRFQRSVNFSPCELWSPAQPSLYEVDLQLFFGTEIVDRVTSYFGMRKVHITQDSLGICRIYLNNKQEFQFGYLDQGFWPDGIYTAPTDAALQADINMQKDVGVNMIRKHVKVEPARWYYHCDRLGMWIWQDMPNGGWWFWRRRNSTLLHQYYSELTTMVQSLYNHPCIIVWVPFNEGWGQFQTKKVVKHLQDLDRTRLIDAASGWFDKHVGDIHSIHRYPAPKSPKPEKKRAIGLTEFGGFGLTVPKHSWIENKSWGYRNLTSNEILTQNYTESISHLQDLISKGLSVGIYTQFTDVEQEVNGILTYDRELLKIPIKTLQTLHKRLYISNEIGTDKDCAHI